MLSVPTLWTAYVVNFLALGLVWAYVTRSYPKFEAARFWTGSAFIAAAGAALAMLRMFLDSLLPLLAAATILIFAACLAAMGVKRFYDRPVSWRGTALISGLSFAGMTFFLVAYDSTAMRILIYSLGQCLPFALTLRLLLSRQHGRSSPGARLAATVATLIIALYVIRVAANLLPVGAGFSFVQFSPLQSALVLVLMFLSMVWNFGCLLMAMDRLRNEVADLALLDDLTDALEAQRHAGALRWRRILHRAARFDAVRGRNDRAPHPGCVPRGRRSLCRSGYPDRAVDRRCAMDPGDRHVPGPADGRRRPCALCRQEGWQELPCRL